VGILEHDPEKKPAPGLDPGWDPVFRTDHAQWNSGQEALMSMIARAVTKEDELAESAFRIAWDYLLGTGYEDCIGHQVAVVSYVNDAIERGVRHKLIIANRAINAFEKAKAEYVSPPAVASA
jgi:Xaa-Pro aminopeptidase